MSLARRTFGVQDLRFKRAIVHASLKFQFKIVRFIILLLYSADGWHASAVVRGPN